MLIEYINLCKPLRPINANDNSITEEIKTHFHSINRSSDASFGELAHIPHAFDHRPSITVESTVGFCSSKLNVSIKHIRTNAISTSRQPIFPFSTPFFSVCICSFVFQRAIFRPVDFFPRMICGLRIGPLEIHHLERI